MKADIISAYIQPQAALSPSDILRENLPMSTRMIDLRLKVGSNSETFSVNSSRNVRVES
jgi:hypothetical protein